MYVAILFSLHFWKECFNDKLRCSIPSMVMCSSGTCAEYDSSEDKKKKHDYI